MNEMILVNKEALRLVLHALQTANGSEEAEAAVASLTKSYYAALSEIAINKKISD
ncbi:MAG: hypothetical protein ABI216_21845 [Devosia sp.]